MESDDNFGMDPEELESMERRAYSDHVGQWLRNQTAWKGHHLTSAESTQTPDGDFVGDFGDTYPIYQNTHEGWPYVYALGGEYVDMFHPETNRPVDAIHMWGDDKYDSTPDEVHDAVKQWVAETGEPNRENYKEY